MHDSSAEVVRRRERAQSASEGWFNKTRSPEPAGLEGDLLGAEGSSWLTEG